MSTIAQQIQAERALAHAPRVIPSAEYAAAAALAMRHARARLRLPAVVPLVWASHPRGNQGETHWLVDGRVEVHINAGLDMSARLVAWTVLHELRHVHDGRAFCAAHYEAAEVAANRFAFDVTERESSADFLQLDWRPARRR